MTDDHSPGDARNRYADTGGPEARHAETHDVRREDLTNPKGPTPVDESFAQDLAPQTPRSIRQAQIDDATGGSEKSLGTLLPHLTSSQLDQLSVLAAGTLLEQGGVYLNLADLEGGPFKAIGGTDVGDRDTIIAKKTTDYEIWNEIAGRDDKPEIERP